MKKIVTLFVSVLFAVVAMGVPARREGIVRTAADGSKQIVYLHGDAFCHYMTNAAGEWIDEETLAPLSAAQIAARKQEAIRHNQARKASQPNRQIGVINAAPRGLVILVSFKDQEFATPVDTIRAMLNSDTYSRDYTYMYTPKEEGKDPYQVRVTSNGSARKYFQDQSFGKYNPEFDVAGPFMLKDSIKYYGENNSSGSDKNAGQMIKEACEKADAAGVDFTAYDNDKDNKLDFVYVLYAGYGENDGGDANTIWPHNYDLYKTGKSCTVDGKQVRNYACSNEINFVSQVYSGIGTFCHEFGHVLGLPDMYETNSTPKGYHTLFEWDVMDYGCYNNDCNTPAGYSAYERFFMGWISPRIMTDPEYVTLQPLNESEEALLVTSSNTHNLNGVSPSPTEFYLLENRKKTGWDAHLPGEGLLITKISYNASKWSNNSVNNSLPMGVDLIEAQANTSYYTEATDAYPAGASSWTGLADHEVTDIQLRSGVISFSYRGACDPKSFDYSWSAIAEDEEKGHVDTLRIPDCSDQKWVFEAIPNDGYTFFQWSNGSTQSRDTVTVTSDTALIAYFQKAAAKEAAVVQPEAKPSETSVVLSWPTIEEAVVYTIEIKKNDELICTLTFNEHGQLTAISVQSSVYGVRKSRQAASATQTETGWQYTFSGLEAGTDYSYSIKPYKENGEPAADEVTVPFRTTDHATGLDSTSGENETTSKILKDNRLIILRGGKVYTITGQEL